ncbi:acyl-CoA dehydrogenase family protein, partial [Rhodococcus sp. 7Tela_A2]|uniref:acyl-CoA dehydrogenase family protein n=1 Tax=Rhodococcus sp. 7Tela_A2 TaxID=3093744 RepID=UPI003BB60AC2
MDFARDETQEDVAGVAADLLARDLGADDLWRAMAEADLLSLALPERLGGSALGVAEAATVLTEVGRSAARIPALPTVGFGVLPVLALATEAQQDVLLDGVPGGAVLSAPRAAPGPPRPPPPRGPPPPPP